jgi:hypothetical protein
MFLIHLQFCPAAIKLRNYFKVTIDCLHGEIPELFPFSPATNPFYIQPVTQQNVEKVKGWEYFLKCIHSVSTAISVLWCRRSYRYTEICGYTT